MPISDDLSLDISSALSSVDQIGTALTDTATTFGSALSDAVAQPLVPTLDDAALTTEVEDALAAASATPVEVEADTATLAGSVDDALAGITEVVPVDADASAIPGEIQGAIDEAPTTATVAVEADTSGAEATISGLQDQIDALGSSATEASGGTGLGQLEKSTTAVGAAAGIAQGETAGLTEGLGGLGPAGAIAAGGIGAVAGTTAVFSKEAIDAQGAQIRLNNTFGDTADAVQQINVGNLNTNLAEVGRTLGVTEAALQNSTASLGNFAKAGGASNEAAGAFANNVTALAARAVALNPSLGSVADVSNRMSTALSRGGRFAANYGLSLTAAEIANEALKETGKSTADQLTIQEKSAAGATLAIQKYGDTLDETITKGAENPIIQLQALTTQITELATRVGQPLVAPLFDLFQSAIPIITDFAAIFGQLDATVLPLAAQVLRAITPLIDQVTVAIGQFISAVGPGLQDAVGGFAELAQSLLPVLVQLTPLIRDAGIASGLFAEALGGLASGVANITGIFDRAGTSLQFVLGLFSNLGTITGPLGNFVALLGGISDLMPNVASTTTAAGTAIFGTATTIDDTRKKLDDLNTSAASYLITQSQFAKTGQVAGLEQTGLTAAEVTRQLNLGSKGLEDFVAAGVAAGNIKIKVDGAEQSADQVGKLNGSLVGLLANGKAQIDQGGDLIAAFRAESDARETAAAKQIEVLRLSGQVTDAQINQAIATEQAAGNTLSYAAALDILTHKQGDQAKAATDTAVNQREANAALGDELGKLATENLRVGTSDDELKKKASDLGISYDKLKGFVDGVKSAYDGWIQSVAQSVPTIEKSLSSIGDDLAQGSNPQKIIDNLKVATQAFVSYRENIQFLIDNHFNDLARLALEKGPEFTNAIVDSIKKGRAGLGAELNNDVAVYQQQQQKTIDTVTQDFGPQLANVQRDAAVEASKQFGGGFTIPDIAAASMAQVPGAIAGQQPGMNSAASAAGTGTTDAYGNTLKPADSTTTAFQTAQATLGALGLPQSLLVLAASAAGRAVGFAFETGITSVFNEQQAPSSDISIATAALVDHIEKIAREEAGAKSPSTVFAAIGIDLAQGLALGIDAGTPQVLSAQEQQVQQLINNMNASLGRAQSQVFFTLDQAVARFGRENILANGDIVNADAVVSGTDAARRAIAGYMDTVGHLSDTANVTTDNLLRMLTATDAITASLKGVQSATAPNAFFGAGGQFFQPGSTQAAPVVVNMPINLPPGTTAADGQAIADSINTTVVPSLERVFATVARS